MARMISLFLCLSLAGVQAVSAQETWVCRNDIGIFVDDAPTPSTARSLAFYDGPPGQFEAYIVCLNPWNENPTSGDARPISVIGGFEFQMQLPTGVFLLNQTYPPGTINFGTPPEFICGAMAPVTPDDTALLVTVTLYEAAGTAGTISIGPVGSPTFPDELAIVDMSDFAASIAHSLAGDYSLPVFGIFTDQVLVDAPCLPLSAVTDERDLPQAVVLDGNVPNPFNPTTTLRFQLPRAAQVNLEILDVSGRRVRRLVAGETYPAGRHEVVWRGRDDSGRTVAAGAYLSRLRADGDVLTGRLLLLK
jgi:hypothetical protein